MDPRHPRMTRPPPRGSRWITVSCHGGPADGWGYESIAEPPAEILVAAVPGPDRFVRTLIEDDATRYVRRPDVEQLDDERIYIPKGP